MAKSEDLLTARLRLVPFSIDFATERYVGWLNDPTIVKYSELRHRRHTLESCLDYISQFDHDTSHLWAIVAKDHGHIGNISVRRDLPNAIAEIGILIGERRCHGMGYGSEAWKAVCDWLFVTGIRKVVAGTMAVNTAMLSVFKNSDMIIEGRCRGQFLLGGRPIDLVFAARFRTD